MTNDERDQTRTFVLWFSSFIQHSDFDIRHFAAETNCSTIKRYARSRTLRRLPASDRRFFGFVLSAAVADEWRGGVLAVAAAAAAGGVSIAGPRAGDRGVYLALGVAVFPADRGAGL